jgi:hypothetical protein
MKRDKKSETSPEGETEGWTVVKHAKDTETTRGDTPTEVLQYRNWVDLATAHAVLFEVFAKLEPGGEMKVLPLEYSRFQISEYDNKRDSTAVDPFEFFKDKFITFTIVKAARRELTYNFAKKEKIWMVTVRDSNLKMEYDLWKSDTDHLCCPSSGDGWTRYMAARDVALMPKVFFSKADAWRL